MMLVRVNQPFHSSANRDVPVPKTRILAASTKEPLNKMFAKSFESDEAVSAVHTDSESVTIVANESFWGIFRRANIIAISSA